MLKLQRPANTPSKQRERFDFKFSNFQALQVPKGWDRLFVSLVSAETGKTIAKLGKALVKNGSCLWSDTISESIHISRHDSSKAYEECLVKFVVSTVSTRSNNTLGEAIIDMAQHAGSRTSAAVSQPLRKCSYGTILQVKIQRATIPRTRIRDEGSRNPESQETIEGVDHFVMESSRSHKSDHSSDSTNKPPRVDLATSSRPLRSDSEEASESGTVVINSFSSVERSYEREHSFVENASKSEEFSSDERRVEGSNGGGRYSVDDDSPAVHLRDDFQNAAAMSRWSASNGGSSRNLIEAAEDTIEELRAEAKMWERNARKLMIDADISRKDYSDLSKKQAELGAELSAAYAEQDGLKRQVEKVTEELQRLITDKDTREAPMVQSQSLQKEMENEMKYQQHLNDELGQQLRQSQESNIELVSVLQELEETIEQQSVEIENLSSLEFKFLDLQNSLDRSSEENKALLLQLELLQESEKNLKSEIQLLDEALRDKTDELEKERELNREILSQVEGEYHNEITSLEGKLSNDADLMGEIEALREKVRVLEKDCSELTDENLELLFKFKDSNKTDIRKCSSFDSMTSESEVSDPKYQVSNMEEEEELKKEVDIAGFESPLHFAEILEQMDVAFHLLMKPWYQRSSGESKSESGEEYLHGLMISNKVDTSGTSVESIRSLFHELNKLLGMRIAESDESLRSHEAEINDRNLIISEARKRMEESILEVQELEKMKTKSEDDNANLIRELEQTRSEIGQMETDVLAKEQEADIFLQRRKELEAVVSELQQKTSRLEQDLGVALRERRLTSECMESLQREITSLSNDVSSLVAVNTSLERNMKEIEIRRDELENTLLGLQEENKRLQEYVSDQETHVHQLKDEKKGCLQEIESFKSCAMSLQEEIRELKDETGIEILDLKQKSEDLRKQWLGSQEECAYLKEENKALQESATNSALGTVELQNLNTELKRENEELHKRCSELEDQLSEMEKSLFDCTKRVESLQSHLTSLQDDFLLRENHLRSELDALAKENSYQKEKLAEEEGLGQLLLEKTADFQRLMEEVELLGKQLYDVREEKERISIEVSSLLTEKAEVQASLQEAKLETESTQNKLNAALQESELNVQDLKDQLAASNQSNERLTIDYERILKLLANYRKIEEKLKTDLNDIELKHTISNYECQQLTREMSSLKFQLQSISDLEDEVSTLKGELEECMLDKGKVELALHKISGDYEELKAEKLSLFEKISVLEDAMYEFEECKRSKVCLEEKLLQIEKELSEKEIMSIQNEGLRNEVTETKRSNMQFQQKMYRLEVEKDECVKKVQDLEDNLKLVEERNTILKEGAHNQDFHDQDHLVVSGDNLTKRELLENEFSVGLDANKSNSSRFVLERQKKSGGVVARERYERTKSSLETELRDLRERYLQMSVKYAEVEEQREDLVMKLKTTRTGQRWFS